MREGIAVSGRSRAAKETLVVSEVEDGFRVYSPDEPSETYLVSGTPDAPTCECRELLEHDADPDWRCKHIIAAFDQAKPMMDRAESAYQPPPPRARLKSRATATPVAVDGPSQMLIKRSVSPDGRIDSLSVEFACPVDKSAVKDIKGRALTALQLQSEIIQSFLADRPKKDPAPERPANGGDGAIAAELLAIGGMDTKWGRRLFINVQANGSRLKLFGSRKQLTEALAAAGYPNLNRPIDEGVELKLPCRVVTRPNGRYIDIERVLPASGSPGGGR